MITLYDTEIPLTPPLNINNKVASFFREKADFFNNLFASWCTPIVNAITLS